MAINHRHLKSAASEPDKPRLNGEYSCTEDCLPFSQDGRNVVATGVDMVNSPTILTRSIQVEIGLSPAGKQGSVSVAGMPNTLWRV